MHVPRTYPPCNGLQTELFDLFDPTEVLAPPRLSPVLWIDNFGAFTEISEEDAHYLARWLWCLHHDQRGKAYVRRPHARRPIYLHRVICERAHGPPPTPEHLYVDHLNGDGLDNRRPNLCWATASENAKNLQVRSSMQAHVLRREEERFRRTGIRLKIRV